MHLPHTLLTLAAAGGLWWAGHAWSCSRPALSMPAKASFLAIPGSAYGSLVARLMRDSLYSYWHGGEKAATAPATAPAAGAKDGHDHAPPPPPPGRFSRLRRGPTPDPQPQPGVPAAEESDKTWLQRRVADLGRLESARTKRNNRYPPTPAHMRYLNASAGWRLRLACELDPGDAVLYEILHYHIMSQGRPAAETQRLVDDLAARAIRHGLSPTASMSDALAGAGAAINQLNDQILRARAGASLNMQIMANWAALNQCLSRYRAVRQQADQEGWWQGIPEIRREEIAAHASLLEDITGMVRKALVNQQLLPQAGS